MKTFACLMQRNEWNESRDEVLPRAHVSDGDNAFAQGQTDCALDQAAHGRPAYINPKAVGVMP
jgi:hypothetical protein